MTPQRSALLVVALVLMTVGIIAPLAEAQIAVSANDNKVVLVNGVVTVVNGAPPDTVSVIDLKASPPRVIGEVPAPVSVAGPPLSVAVTPDESLALVTASNKVDPSDRTKQAPNNQVSVIDLKANPPAVLLIVRVTGKTLARVAEAPIGHWSQGVAWSPDGKTLLVGNMVEKDYWVFSWDGAALKDTGQRVKVNGGPAAIRSAEK
jgi:DNA-binding beta-propeller fold protein YncE